MSPMVFWITWFCCGFVTFYILLKDLKQIGNLDGADVVFAFIFGLFGYIGLVVAVAAIADKYVVSGRWQFSLPTFKSFDGVAEYLDRKFFS